MIGLLVVFLIFVLLEEEEFAIELLVLDTDSKGLLIYLKKRLFFK
jgi:hypothetical protein